jgi:hypothetical protein
MRIKLLIVVVLLSLAACGGPRPPAPQTPTTMPTPAANTPAATAAPATDAPQPAATATTAPAIEATTPVAVTPEAVSQLGPVDFPADVNPLTGLQLADPAVLERRPLAVKVSQFPRSVRPQSGLSLADLVFEHYAEAGVSRMTAIFLSDSAPKIGSIRSARLIDIVLAESYSAMLVTSGSSQGVLNALSRTPFYDRVIAEATGYDHCPPLCREGPSASTHNLFTNADDIWQTAADLGLNTRQNLNGMAFNSDPPAGGQPAGSVHLDFQLDNNVSEWRFDEASGKYARWVDTATAGQLAPHTDAVNGQQITASNVVVIYANHVTTDIPEDFGNGGHCGYEIQLWGSGPAVLFRDGLAYELSWVRFVQTEVIGFVGPDNQAFAFKPGNTWFEILNINAPATFENGVYRARFRGPSQSQGCPVG